MSGAVAVGSLVVVIELGAPVASHLGLGPGTIPAGNGGAVSQALGNSQAVGNPTAPNWGLAATSVANAPSSAVVAVGPTVPASASGNLFTNVVSSSTPASAGAPPAAATNGGVSSHVVAAPTAAASVPSTNDGSGAAVHASVLVAAPTSGQAAPGQDTQPGGRGQNGQHGQGNGNGGQGNANGNGAQGNGNGNGGSNVPPGRAVGHSSH